MLIEVISVKINFPQLPYSWHYACQILLYLKKQYSTCTLSKPLSFHWEVGTDISRSKNERPTGFCGWYNYVWMWGDKNRRLNETASQLGLKDKYRLSSKGLVWQGSRMATGQRQTGSSKQSSIISEKNAKSDWSGRYISYQNCLASLPSEPCRSWSTGH